MVNIIMEMVSLKHAKLETANKYDVKKQIQCYLLFYTFWDSLPVGSMNN